MAIVNVANREIIAKVVYFGAPKAGCNTNVERLHHELEAGVRTELHRFGPQSSKERSLYFEYTPSDAGLFTGFSCVFRVYSLPGGLHHGAHREEVLRGVDAVVFVCDARRDRGQDNLDRMIELEKALDELGLKLAALPTVLQINHTDATDARTPDEIAFELNPYGFPVIAAAARSGVGVMEAHETVRRETLSRIKDSLSGLTTGLTVTSVHRSSRESDGDVVARHLAAIERADAAALAASREPGPVPASLPLGETVELPFQPREYLGTRPVQVLEARLDGDRVMLDLVMDRLSGGKPRRLGVVLVNRPPDEAPMPRPVHATSSSEDHSASASLPDRIELPPPPPEDFPPVWYGMAGIAGGALVGLLLGFLAFG